MSTEITLQEPKNIIRGSEPFLRNICKVAWYTCMMLANKMYSSDKFYTETNIILAIDLFHWHYFRQSVGLLSQSEVFMSHFFLDLCAECTCEITCFDAVTSAITAAI